MNEIHRSKVGTYHPAPAFLRGQKALAGNEAVWTINDTRGYLDNGPACDECRKCECGPCDHGCKTADGSLLLACLCEKDTINPECIGLSFAYICLDGGDALCEDCAEKAGVTITDCDCA